MSISTIVEPISSELSAVEKTITQTLNTEVPLINQVVKYIVGNGGKRLRPVVLLLTAGACGYQGGRHIDLACAVEFIHTATLLHDDVVDTSTMRRGKAAVHQQWNNSTSILVGDFLYSKAFQLLVQAEDLSVLKIVADGTNKIAEGETRQLMNRHQSKLDEESYLSILKDKTGKLFEISACLGTLIAGSSIQVQQALNNYGMHLGLAFQLIDDVLDYAGTLEDIGKNVGDDLAKGSPTLPLLYVLWHGNAEQQSLIRQAIEQGDTSQLAKIKDTLEQTSALNYTKEKAQHHAKLAIDQLSILPDSNYKLALTNLVTFAIDRNH